MAGIITCDTYPRRLLSPCGDLATYTYKWPQHYRGEVKMDIDHPSSLFVCLHHLYQSMNTCIQVDMLPLDQIWDYMGIQELTGGSFNHALHRDGWPTCTNSHPKLLTDPRMNPVTYLYK